MTEPAQLTPSVRLDDLITAITRVHTEPLDQLTDAVIAAVSYVAGMTDRFALTYAASLGDE